MPPKVGLTFRHERKAVAYRNALIAAGLHPVDLTPGGGASLDGLQGLLLSGGSDIEPARYGQASLQAKTPDPLRDELELSLTRQALDAGMPLFAICRGMQLLNVACGGTLLQDIGESHTNVTHPVAVDPGSHLHAITGPECLVNSRHHQAVDRLGDGLRIVARAHDGVVEAVEFPAAPFVFAVQWHPEDMLEPDTGHNPLFQHFSSAVIDWKR